MEEGLEASKDNATKTISVFPLYYHYNDAIVTLEERSHWLNRNSMGVGVRLPLGSNSDPSTDEQYYVSRQVA